MLTGFSSNRTAQGEAWVAVPPEHSFIFKGTFFVNKDIRLGPNDIIRAKSDTEQTPRPVASLVVPSVPWLAEKAG